MSGFVVIDGGLVRQMRAARALLGWTQAALAAEAGLNKTTVTRYEYGEPTISRETIALMRAAVERAGIRFARGGLRVAVWFS